jgi:CYTH domain-containing protein
VGIEIERKFLVRDHSVLAIVSGVRISQGYLSFDPDRTVRVRVAEDGAWLTIKGRGKGISRAEFEYAIPVEEARQLLEFCTGSVVDKTRHKIHHAGHLWEVDVFHGDNDGLIVAEVELDSEEESVELPEWIGAEVSDDPRYFNAKLAREPFCQWGGLTPGGPS